MKTLIIIVASLGIVTTLVWFGWCLGERHRILEEAAADATIDGRVVQARQLSDIIDALGTGKTDDAKNFLSLQLYGHVMYIDMWFDHASLRSRQEAQDVFTSLAQRRSRWATNYSTEFARSTDIAMKRKLESVLSRAKGGSK